MTEFKKVTTKEELDQLNDDEIIAGYDAGRRDDTPPDSTKSKSYWHGWRNGVVDSGKAKPDSAQRALAHDCRDLCVSTLAMMELMFSDETVH